MAVASTTTARWRPRICAPAARGILSVCVFESYPQLDGFKFDWPEIPAYHSRRFSSTSTRRRSGLRRRRDSSRNTASGRVGIPGRSRDGRGVRPTKNCARRRRCVQAKPFFLLSDPRRSGGVQTEIVRDFTVFLKQTVDDASGGTKAVFLQCFPPPLNVATGFDFATVGAQCDMVGVKCYTMHWPLIERNFLPGPGRQNGFRTVRHRKSVERPCSGFPRGAEGKLKNIRYPEPHEPHPAPSPSLSQKMKVAKAALPQTTRMCGITHGYGPIDDVMRRFDAVASGADGSVHVNRYGTCRMPSLTRLARAFEAPPRRNGRQMRSRPRRCREHIRSLRCPGGFSPGLFDNPDHVDLTALYFGKFMNEDVNLGRTAS